MTLAMTFGIWEKWYGPEPGLSAFAVTYLISALGAATTDTCSALWAMGIAWFKGKFGDFLRTIKTGPGLVMAAAALIGGPLASTSYVVGLQMAGSIIVPISALCPAIGAILGRVLFKQPLNARMVLGIFICFAASALIGSTGFDDSAPENLFLGLFFGLLAALGWGIEGCVCGYGTSMIDPEVGITIRQTTSGLSNLFLLVPLFAFLSDVSPLEMITLSFTDTTAMPWFLVAGFAAYWGFMLWYKGNAMCGAALGMACNGMFSFWGPFWCWIIIGVIFEIPGWTLSPVAWFAAVLMVIGIFTIAMNPLDLFRKTREAA
jgi:drug/metabolite transporter (DMT)-like permease